MKVSLIIPTLNEANYCSALFITLKQLPFDAEVIVVDGGSTDGTKDLVLKFGFKLYNSPPGRARQMAVGAEASSGDYLLFLHADVKLDSENLVDLENALKKGIELASFRIAFDLQHWFLTLNAVFSLIPHPYFHFGDQGLWISKALYQKSGGFDKEMMVLEDQHLYTIARRHAKAYKFQSKLIVSARKYKVFGVFELQFFYYRFWLMYKLGYSQHRLSEKYEQYFRLRTPDDT